MDVKDEHLYRFTMLQQSQSNLFRVQANAVLMKSHYTTAAIFCLT